MILENTAKQCYAAYSATYVSMAYDLPSPQVYLAEIWLKETSMDLVEIVKRMMKPRKNFRTRPSEEYDTSTLRAPYRFIALIINRVFGRAHGKSFKIGWIPVIFFVATQGTIFNWEKYYIKQPLCMHISILRRGLSKEIRVLYELYTDRFHIV